MKTRRPPSKAARVPADVPAEKALLALIFVHGLEEVVEQMHPADFFDDVHRWLFKELRLMWEAGEPLDCGAACAAWFTSPACVERAKEAGLRERPGYMTAVTVREEFASLAHKDYLVRRLRTMRIERQLSGLCGAAVKYLQDNPGQAIEAMQRLQNGLGKLFGLTAEILPEATACDV